MKKKKRIWQEHERKESSLNELRSSLFSLSSSILHLSQFNLKSTPISPEGLNSFSSCKYSLSLSCFYSLCFLQLSEPHCETMPVRKEISIRCLLFDCFNEWVAFFWILTLWVSELCPLARWVIERALWWFSMHDLSYSTAREALFVIVLVHSLQTGFLWVFRGRINTVNRLCVCVCALMQLMEIFSSLYLRVSSSSLLAQLISSPAATLQMCGVWCSRCCKFMFVQHNQCPPTLTS